MQLPFRWPFLQPPRPDRQPRLLTQGAVLPAGVASAGASKHWLLSRPLYRCRHLRLGHVAGAQRRAVLRNLLLAWAPFDQAEYRVAWQGDGALAVAWDRVAVAGLLSAAGASSRATLRPETLMREPMASDGVRAVPCLEGIEWQVWRQHALLASRWWPSAPRADEALTWLRSVGVDEAALNVAPVAWRRTAWADLLGLEGLASTHSRTERIAVGAAVVGLAALTAAQAHQSWAAYTESQAVQAQRERLVLESAPVMAARDRAEAMSREATVLAAQLSGVLPLELLEHLADVLPARGATLKELDLSGQKLRLALELAADVPRSAVVKDMQAGAWLAQVTEVRDASTGAGWIVFDAVLAGSRAPPTPPRPPRPAVAPVAPVAPAAVAPLPAPVAVAPVPATPPTPTTAASPAPNPSVGPDSDGPRPRRIGPRTGSSPQQ